MRLGVRISRSAFTLLELLMVIAIIGIVTAIVSPRIGAAMGGGRLRVGTRSVIQSARYARAMALLHQIDVDLVFDLTPEKARVRVEASPLSGERADGGATGRIDLDAGDEGSDGDDGGRRSPEASGPFPGFQGDGGLFGSAAESGAKVSAAALAAEIATEIESPGCTFAFDGYTDTSEKPGKGSHDEETEARIHFNSNGTCRPFSVSVSTSEDDVLHVSFDILGAATVSEDPPR